MGFPRLAVACAAYPHPVHSTASGCTSQGSDVAADLAGTQHFGGRANQDPPTANCYIVDLAGNSGGYTWSAATAAINRWGPQE